MMLSSARLLALSNRVYCLLLYLYPVPFRQEYGYHMAQLFRDDVRGTLRDSGRLAVVGLWLLAFFDLLKTAVAEHIWEIFHMPIEKLTRWSGPAAALAGLLYAIGIISIIYGIAPFIISILVTIPLFALGIFGLYKCLAATDNRLNKFVFIVTIVGLLGTNIGAAIVAWQDTLESNWAIIIYLGAGFWILGFVSMGIIGIKNQALGRLSFTPLLVVLAYIGLGVVGTGVSPTSPEVTAMLIVYASSWVLLGVALWQTYEEPQEPGMLA
ncbi:MAG: hypothetical protein KC419_04200 [Anaerolineales bacterium]|nr:hypothetical protein [Anaerolineales bacterium]